MAKNCTLFQQRRAAWGPLSRHLVVFALAGCYWGSAAFAQTPASQADSASVPQSASVSVVENPKISFTLVARDKKNRPVLDLRPADVAANDSSNSVQLSDLHLVSAQSGAATAIVLLFDRMSPESAKLALGIEAKLVPMMPDRTSIAVFSLDRGLRLFQNFTTDRAAIANSVSQALNQTEQRQLSEAEKQLISIAQTGVNLSGANASIEERSRARSLLSALEESQRIVQDQQAPVALAGLQALAKAQQDIPGRKIVVFVSGGISDNSKNKALVHDVVEAANHAAVNIYTVDTNGVRTKTFDVLTMMYAPPQATPVRNTPGISGILPGQTGSRIGQMADANPDAYSASALEAAKHKPGENSLALLANETGGFPIIAEDDMREPLQRFANDIGTYYEATYTPALKDYDGQFHPIDIKALRGGITIASRPGYYALPSGAAGSFGMRPFEAPLLNILGAAQLPTDLVFQQALLRVGEKENKTEQEVIVDVPVSSLELHQDPRTQLFAAHASVLAQVKDKSGTIIERFSEDFSRSGALESLETARTEVLTLQRHFAAAPGDYQLEIAVLDRLGGKAGAQRTAFTIPNADPGPWLSDVALVRGTVPLGDSPDPLEPMQYAKARIVPDLSGQVSGGTESIRFFFSTRLDDRQPNRSGKLDVDVLREGTSVLQSTMNIDPGPGSAATVNLTKIESKSFLPGSYRAVFTYSQGDEKTSRELSFNVDGKPPSESDNSGETVADATNPGPTDSAADAESIPEGLTDLAPGRFTPAQDGPSQRPTETYLNGLVASAQQRALDYVQALVNFECLEITDRYMVPKGARTWTRHDKIAEMVSFENQEESRRVLEVDGKSAGASSYDMQGARLEGEFGGVLKIVFDPVSKATFTWKETDSIDGSTVQVFSYRVEAPNSKFSVTPLPNAPTIVAFHGLVYIDAATRGVRRITMEAEGIPTNAPVRASAVTIDYDYFDINEHDYLMPVRGELRMKLHNQKAIFHRIEFRDYHRFGSETKILGVTQ